MKHDSINVEAQETAALYALGSLSQHEAKMFEIHLRDGCEVCSLEMRQFERVAAELGAAVAPLAPPAYVRDLLVMRIQREAAESAATLPSSVIPFSQARADKSAPTPRSSFGGALLPWAVAAALLIASAYAFTVWRAERRTLQAEVAHERESATAALADSADLRERLSKQNAELTAINSVLSSPQFRTLQLAGQDVAPGSSATVYWNLQANRWVVTASLPPAPEGKVYQLWFVTAQAKISAGLIAADKAGHGFLELPYPTNIGQLAAAAITLEPAGGSEQPTSAIYVLGKV